MKQIIILIILMGLAYMSGSNANPTEYITVEKNQTVYKYIINGTECTEYKTILQNKTITYKMPEYIKTTQTKPILVSK